jgi:hypothetical protein
LIGDDAASSPDAPAADSPVSAEPAPPPAPPADPGTLQDFLDRLGARIPASAIDEVWIFPVRRAGPMESTVIALAAYDPDDARRRLFTARYTVTRDPKGKPIVEETLEEQGTAPAERVNRVIEGVLRRLGDDSTDVPRNARIGGDASAWSDLRNG